MSEERIGLSDRLPSLRRFRWLLIAANVVAIYVLVWLGSGGDGSDESAPDGSSMTATTASPDATSPAASEPATSTTRAPTTSTGQSTAPADPGAGPTIELLLEDPRFSALRDALTDADLVDSLAGGTYTVFAPTDRAFESVDADAREAIRADPDGLLTDLLLNHVVDGSLDATAAAATGSVLTLAGETLDLRTVEGADLVVGAGVLVSSTVVTEDGIIHVVDQLLVPSSVSSTLTASELSALFELEPIRFADSSAAIEPESFAALDAAAEVLSANPDARVEIGGHTDDVGPPDGNQRLSERRAEAVRDHLVDAGVDGSRLVAVGYGQNQPIADNSTPDGRAANRRIEFTPLTG